MTFKHASLYFKTFNKLADDTQLYQDNHRCFTLHAAGILSTRVTGVSTSDTGPHPLTS